jgi:hypothetical protein
MDTSDIYSVMCRNTLLSVISTTVTLCVDQVYYSFHFVWLWFSSVLPKYVRWMINVHLFVHSKFRTAVGLRCAPWVFTVGYSRPRLCPNVSRLILLEKNCCECTTESLCDFLWTWDDYRTQILFVCVTVCYSYLQERTTGCLTLKRSMWNKLVKVLNGNV